MNFTASKILIISVAGLILLRIFIVFLVPHLPHLEQYKISNLPDVRSFKYDDYFSAIKEGDDIGYYYVAEMVYNADFREEIAASDALRKTLLGYPLTIVPFIFIFGRGYASVFFPLVIFNGILLFSLTLIFLVWSAFLIFRKIWPAVFSGFLFLMFPFIFYVFRNYGPQFKTGAWNDVNFMHINWLAAMADQPATFLAGLILLLLLLAERKKFGMVFYSLIGFLAGFSAMVRVTNIVFAAAAGLIIFLYESEKKYRKLFFYGLFALLGFLPQFLYNFVFFGSPISFGYQTEYRAGWLVGAKPQNNFMWSFGNFSHLFSRAVDYSWLAVPAFLIILALIIFGILRILKMNKRQALIAGLWFFLPVFIYMFFRTGQDAMRYYMPAVPAFIILSVAAAGWIGEKINYLRRLPGSKPAINRGASDNLKPA